MACQTEMRLFSHINGAMLCYALLDSNLTSFDYGEIMKMPCTFYRHWFPIYSENFKSYN